MVRFVNPVQVIFLRVLSCHWFYFSITVPYPFQRSIQPVSSLELNISLGHFFGARMLRITQLPSIEEG